MRVKEFSYPGIIGARKKQRSMKKMYGYTPEILKVTHPTTRRSKFIVVKPSGLKRIW